MGLLLNVLKHPSGDCTNGGISSTTDTLCVVNVAGPFKPSSEQPAVILQQHIKGALRLVPATLHNGDYVPVPGWHMAGGNYATGDSRLTQAAEALLGHPFYGAIAIHDRVEP